MNGLIFFIVVAAALALVVMDIVVNRRRGVALHWSIAAGVVLLAGGIVHAIDESGLIAVIVLVAGAACLTLSDRAADANAAAEAA
jgi:hypothetical protein